MQKTKNKILLGGGALGLVFLIGLIVAVVPREENSIRNTPQATTTETCQLTTLPRQEVSIKGRPLTVAVASQQSERVKGLKDCTELKEIDGMLFVFPTATTTAFWMKDMVIPLDIVWITNNTIISIESNIAPPLPNTPDEALKQYPSPGAVDAVLELPAGKAEEYNLALGSKLDKGITNQGR